MNRFQLAVFNTQPPHLCFGGVERRIIETTKRLQKRADITVYSGTKAGFKAATTVNGVQFVPCYSTDRLFPLDNWFFNRSLTKKAHTINADIYEAHAVSGYGFPRTLKKQRNKRPFIHTIHGVLADEYEQTKASGYQSLRGRVANYFMHHLANLEKQTAQEATLVVTISNYSLEKMQLYYNIDKTKVRIVPNGVDIEVFKPTANVEAARRQLGLGDSPVVLFIGSLIPRKGLPFLVKAAKKIVKDYSSAEFLIVGNGPQKNTLINLLNKNNLSSNFKFLGNVGVETLPAIYNCADVFALPSIQEGQGIVLLEAQASGVPVVAFDVGGIRETVQNGVTGFLVRRGDSDELANALLKLLSDKSLRELMGGKGRKLVSTNFTWDICAKGMFDVYQEALSMLSG